MAGLSYKICDRVEAQHEESGTKTHLNPFTRVHVRAAHRQTHASLHRPESAGLRPLMTEEHFERGLVERQVVVVVVVVVAL